MIRDGLLDRVMVYEARQAKHGGEVNATVIRYGLPGSCKVMRDTGSKREAIDGVSVRID